MSDCQMLTNKPRKDGYVRLYRDGKHQYAHRYVYEKSFGTIPEGLEIDHICENRACINIAHLKATSHRVNMSHAKTRTLHTGFCRNGHDLSERGIYINPTSGPTCVRCNREAVRKWRELNKEKV